MPIAVYDPDGAADAFNEIFNLDEVEIAGTYVQQTSRIGEHVLGRAAAPITELGDSAARAVFIAAFDADRMIAQLQPCFPDGARAFSLDAMRIPGDRLTNRTHYLDKLNFATNFAFFRDADSLHTRLVTVNYWSGYGAQTVTGWMTLFAGDGEVLAEWCESFGSADNVIVLDSREIRARFRLPEFCGQLFIHVVGVAGHDIVKYALDTFDDTGPEVDSRPDTAANCSLS
jgi:hypothetical protein